jgi:FdhD protein
VSVANALAEAPVWISVNGERRMGLTCTPTAVEALAVGHLLAEGWIRSLEDVQSLTTVDGPGGARGVAAVIPADLCAAANALRRHQMTHGCGVRHFLDCETLRPRHTADETALELDETALELGASFRALFGAADAASPTGGVHAVALCSADGGLRYTSVDVARHCAVDRVLGLSLLAGDNPASYGLLLTSRVSGMIALKAVRAGVAWLASRSLGTPLARELAGAEGMPLLEQAARRERKP